MVARQFYSDQHVIVVDLLSKYQVMPADILASSLGIQIKDLLQIANQLVRDRLLGIYKRSETRETATATSVFTRSAIRNYFYIDRKVFLDVTKWRMMKMRSQIDSVLRNELDNKGYMCPRCGKSYSTLDVAALLDPVTNLAFICDVPGCGSELVDNEDAEDVRRSKDRLKRFNEQCGPILDRLRRIDTIVLPSFDAPREVNRTGDSDAWKLRARQRIDPNATMNDVRESQTEAADSMSMEVILESSDPAAEAARRARREREVEQQRQENAMPDWWLASQDPGTSKRANGRAGEANQLQTQAANASTGEDAVQSDCELIYTCVPILLRY
jgi:transcription initiation factor TFIIE subunit alpha